VNRAIRMQGALFCVIAVLGTLTSVFLPRMPPRVELVTVAVLIAILGVPHGALDTVFARQRFALRATLAWVAFAVVYGVMMLSVVSLWWAAPGVFLLGFVVISAWHFSGDPVSGTPTIIRIVQGGAVLILPALRHRGELATLFGMLVTPAAAEGMSSVLSLVAMPWAAAVVLCCVAVFRRSLQTSLELLAVGTLASFATPLLGFTIFFCGMHSARHVLRTVSYAESGTRRSLATAIAAPMLGVACLAVLAWLLRGDLPLATRVVQLVFVGLASVTVPHMALVEPVRLAGWRDG
jgi:beta-carotene 15,15'-dioxygenase